LDWGFANRWRCYVTGFIAQGGIDTTGGITRPEGTEASGSLCPLAGADSRGFRFPVTGGRYDSETGGLEVDLGGTVRFWGHVSGGKPALDTTFSALSLVAQGDSGQIFADVTGATQEDPEPVTREHIPVVDVDLAGAGPTVDGDSVSWSGATTTLTAQGAEAFGSYPEGEPFDPVSTDLALGEVITDPDPDPDAKGPAPKLKSAAHRQRLNGKRVVRLGTVICPAVKSCRILTPRKVRIKVSGRRFTARVLSPSRIAAGRAGTVKVKLPGKAARHLEGGKAVIKLTVRASHNGMWTKKNLKVTVRR
jgi:hypothetical protein